MIHTLLRLMHDQTGALIIGSALVAWTVIITHFPNHNLTTRVSLFVGMPLVVLGLSFGVLAAYHDTIDKEIQAQNLSYIRGRTDELRSGLDRLSDRIQEINGELNQGETDIANVKVAAKSLNDALSSTSQQITDLLKQHSAALKEIQKNGSTVSQALQAKTESDRLNSITTQGAIQDLNDQIRRQQYYQDYYSHTTAPAVNAPAPAIIGVPIGHGLIYNVQ